MSKSNLFSEVLQREFEKRRQRNSKYSLRAFARFLGLQPATLSHILNNKRVLSIADTERIGRLLELKERHLSDILIASQGNMATDPGIEFYHPSKREAEALAPWYAFAALNVLEIPGAETSAKGIAKRLGCTSTNIASVMRIYVKMGVVEKIGDNFVMKKPLNLRLERSPKATITGLREYLALGAPYIPRSFEPEHMDSLVFSGMTVTTTRQRVKEAKVLITNFRRSLAHFLGDVPPAEYEVVYRLGIELFPAEKLRRRHQ